MAQSNPIYSHDLYQPGSEDQLKLLHARLVQLQEDMKNMTTLARSLKTSLSGININNGSAQKQIVELAQKVERLNQELEKTKQAHQRTQQQIERTRAAEQNRLTASIRAEDALTRAIDNQNERRSASSRRQQAHDQALDQRRIASAQRASATQQRLNAALQASAQRASATQQRLNAALQASAQRTAAAIANMNALNNARVQSISQSRQISQARANAQAAIQAQRLTIAQNQAAASALRLQRAQQSAAESAKRHSGSLRGLLSSLRSITYAYFSLSAIQQIVGKLFSETKALNTLDIALKQTLGSIQSVTEAKQFLLDITERYGADLLTTSNAYLKFGTAAKQAGVSAQDTRNIFESVTKASSVLGLGAERTSYVFLALEQIMSKGRLSTEELRRQLGEHLPGAFGIAAKAMKVTTTELTDMLKKGEIASTDFLPKFAKELEKTYGIENLKRVDNLAAAQGRFNNEITLLIRELDVAGFFKDFFDSLASGVKFVRENVDAFLALGKALLYVGAAWAAWKIGAAVQGVSNLTKAMTALNAAMKANPAGVILAGIVALAGVADLLIDKIDSARIANNALNDSVQAGTDSTKLLEVQINQLASAYADENTSAKEKAKILKQLNALGIEANDINRDGKITTDELTASIDKQIKSLQLRAQIQQLENSYNEIISKITELKGKSSVEIPGLIGDLLRNFDATFGSNITTTGKGINLAGLEDAKKLIEEQLRSLYLARLNGNPLDPTANPNPDDPTDPSKKDPRLVELERLKFLNSLRREGMAKDLEALALNLAEKRILYEKDAEVLAKIEEYKWQQIQAIREKYVSIEADRQEQDTKDLIEGLNTVAESVAKAFAARASGNLGQTAEQKQTEFDLQQAHEKRLFELHEENADKREKFDIQQEIDLINFKLKLNEQYGGLLNEKEIQRLNELRDALQIELGKPIKAGKKEVDIFSLLGIDFGGDNDKLDAFKSTIKIVGDELSSFVDLQKELVDQQIEDADRLVRSKEEALNRQIALAAANQANNVAGAQAELALAKKTQEEALKQRKKVQKQELALDTLAQSSNIITAITAALKLGPILGPIAVGAILATFAASKIKALALINKKTFRKGGYREIGGGTHESGNDTHVGGNNWAEKDESVGIFTAKATRKYKPTLKAFVNAANKGTLDKILFQDRRAIQGITNNYGPRVDTSVMEKRLGRLVSLTEKKSYVDGSGNLVINDRGRTTIVRNGSK